MIPNDFQMKTKFGVGRDWPISYDDLEPRYYEAEVEIGVGGSNDGRFVPRSEPFPHPAMELPFFDKIFKEKIVLHGYITEPVTRNTAPFDGRPACAGNNSCMPICPIGVQYTGRPL